jgi:carbon monoxide dehydrogenase subunit G
VESAALDTDLYRGHLLRGGQPMPQVHAEVTIDQPIEQVFSYISDPRNESHWMPGATGISNVSDGPTHVGTTYDSMVHFLGRRMDFAVEVTELNEPREYGYRSKHGALEAQRQFSLEPVEGGSTQIRMDLRAHSHHSVLRFAEDVLLRAGRRHEQHSLENLRDILETHGPDHPRHDQ